MNRNYFQNVFAVSGRQLARRDSSCLTARVRITESAMRVVAGCGRRIAKVAYSDHE